MRFLTSFTVIFGLLAADAGHETRIAQWRAAQESKLKADDGWLTVTGLFWLKEGANTFGSASSNRIVLPAHSAAPRAGVFELRGGKVRVQLESQVAATVGGEVVREAYLRSDAAGQPDRLLLGDLTLFVIERGGRYAIRLKDKRSALRRDFRGLDWFPVRSTYHVEARFHPYGTPRPVRVATATGGTEQYVSPGYVSFALEGRQLRLDPVLESPASQELFFIFRDRTAGQGTYPAGRFLYTPLPQNGRVVLDFNKAENPPCAYTPYATCPLPPKENRLPVAIEAGEKYGH
jgi:uncharacterized protein